MLARCIAAGLVGGEAFGVDASLIKADANREDGIEPERWAPKEHASRATTEYLETLDDAAFGAATPVQPKYVSPVDLAARWSAADRGKAHFLYSAKRLEVAIDVLWMSDKELVELSAEYQALLDRPLGPTSVALMIEISRRSTLSAHERMAEARARAAPR